MRRRRPRILLNAATGMSLALCVATVVLWVRSHHVADRVYYRTTTVYTNRGHWQVVSGRPHLGEPWPRIEWNGGEPPANRAPLAPGFWGSLGFAWHHAHHGETVVASPLWAATLLCGLLPCWRLLSFIRPRGSPAAGCPACGYDLRATPARCPECGATPPAPPAAPRG